MRTPVSWVGNKTSILSILYSKFPLHYNRYIEPFGGSGAVLLGKEKPDPFEVYNDYNRDLVNLFNCIRDRPMALIQQLKLFPLNARDDFNVIRSFLSGEDYPGTQYLQEELELTRTMLAPPEAEDVRQLLCARSEDWDCRRAAMYLKMLRTSYASTGESFAARSFSLADLCDLILKVSKRLERTIIENQDFERLICHHDRKDTFTYCDPPYVDTEHFYPGGFNWNDHLRLFDTLDHAQGKWLLSYNDCTEVRRLYWGYEFYSFKRPHAMAQRYGAGKEFPELLIANYDMNERSRLTQMSLFT